jgi:hypothetical protein
MANIEFLLGGYIAATAIVAFYIGTLARRAARIRAELRRVTLYLGDSRR